MDKAFRNRVRNPNSDADPLLRIVDAGLMATIFVAPLFMGGRHPVGHFVYVLLIALTGAAWLVRQCLAKECFWRPSLAEWIVLGGLVVLILQLTPLPEHLLHAAAPYTSKLLPLWSSQADSSAQLGVWDRISAMPSATRGSLALFLSYGFLFVIVVQRIQHLDDAFRILRWIAMAAVCMATFGLVQFLTSNGKFVWIYEHPFRSVTGVQGSFVNRNHFAHLLALGIGPLAFWIVTRFQAVPDQRKSGFGGGRSREVDIVPIVLLIGLGIVLFAGLMSLSRGGALALATATLVTAGLFYSASLITKQHCAALLVLTVIVGSALFVHGFEDVSERLDDFATASFDELDEGQARRKIWRANYLAFLESPWIGWGAGTHREVYKIYVPETLPKEYSHAECGYLQIATETGVAGLALLAAGIGCCVYWCGGAILRCPNAQFAAAVTATTAGLAASVVHSVADFVWYIPACISWTLILAAVASRLHELSAQEGRMRSPQILPRWACASIAGLFLLISTWLVWDRFHPVLASKSWDAYLKKSQQLAALDGEAMENILVGAPTHNEQQAVLVDQMAADLQQYVEFDGEHGRAHIRLAAIWLRRFQELQKNSENPMELAQIRDAALASQFSSREALYEWLDRAVGPHRVFLDKALWHARRGLQICPLQGEGCLYLAELCFLEGKPATSKSSFVNQALTVRPHDGDILFVAGKESLLGGDIETAAKYWRGSFHSGARQQQQLVALLAGRVPIDFMLEQLKPRLTDWLPLHVQYAKLNMPAETERLCDYFVALAQHSDAEGADRGSDKMWMTMHRSYIGLNELEKAGTCIQRAYELEPDRVEVRNTYAIYLLKTKRHEEAEQHIRWCLQRRPGEQKFEEMLEAAVKGKINDVAGSSTAQRNVAGQVQ